MDTKNVANINYRWLKVERKGNGDPSKKAGDHHDNAPVEFHVEDFIKDGISKMKNGFADLEFGPWQTIIREGFSVASGTRSVVEKGSRRRADRLVGILWTRKTKPGSGRNRRRGDEESTGTACR